MLIDFGSCHLQGAPRLTWQSLAPGTPAYFSSQAQLFHLRCVRERDGYYPPSPADDLFALGVTAYRLVTGRYPPEMEARQDDSGAWQVLSPDPRPLLESNPQVRPELREWILRLLSEAPEQRGTAAQAAEALEAEAREHMPLPTSPPTPEAAAPAAPAPEPLKPREPRWSMKPWLALTAVGAAAVLLWSVLPLPGHTPVSTRQGSGSQEEDAGTSGVADTAPTAPLASVQPASKPEPLTQESPPEPRPGQARPDKRGQCPGRLQVAINGGCWIEANSRMDAQACVEGGYVFFRGRCYSPALVPPKKQPPTSNPTQAR